MLCRCSDIGPSGYRLMTKSMCPFASTRSQRLHIDHIEALLDSTFIAGRGVWSYHRLQDCEYRITCHHRVEHTFSISGPLYFVKRAAAIRELGIKCRKKW